MEESHRNKKFIPTYYLTEYWCEVMLSVDQYVANFGLSTTPIWITITHRVSISALSVVSHWKCQEVWSQIILCHSMHCCAYRLIWITILSICSVIYSLKKSCAVGFLGRSTSILSSQVNCILLGLNGSPLNIFYSTAREKLLAECLRPTCPWKPGVVLYHTHLLVLLSFITRGGLFILKV